MSYTFPYEDKPSFKHALHIARTLRASLVNVEDELTWGHLTRAADGLVLNLAQAWQSDPFSAQDALTCASKVHVLLQLSTLEDRHTLIQTLRTVAQDIEELRLAENERYASAERGLG
jgi:hypothetical protein